MYDQQNTWWNGVKLRLWENEEYLKCTIKLKERNFCQPNPVHSRHHLEWDMERIKKEFKVRRGVEISVISSYLLGGIPHNLKLTSPRKTPKQKETLKNASNLPPRYVSPQNRESRVNTGLRILQVGTGLHTLIGSLYSVAIWSISINRSTILLVSEICLKPFLGTKPDDECMHVP